MPFLRLRGLRLRASRVPVIAAALAVTALAVVGIAAPADAAPLRPAARVEATTTWTLPSLYIDGAGSASASVVGNGGSLVLTAGYGWRSAGTPAPARVVLQRRIGSGAWTTTTAPVGFVDHQGFSVSTPAYRTKPARVSVAYRLVSKAYSDAATGGVLEAATSPTVRIVYENQAKYTGLARTIYRAAQQYCPSTAVHVQALAGGRAGQYDTGGLVLAIIPSVATYRPIDVRAVALHECSHERQWLNYGGTEAGRTAMEAAAAQYFSTATKPAKVTTSYVYEAPTGPIDPVEHAADCGAQAVNPGGYLGYGGWCTPAQLQHAKRLMLGHRY